MHISSSRAAKPSIHIYEHRISVNKNLNFIEILSSPPKIKKIII